MNQQMHETFLDRSFIIESRRLSKAACERLFLYLTCELILFVCVCFLFIFPAYLVFRKGGGVYISDK